jgi:hypothetical protein
LEALRGFQHEKLNRSEDSFSIQGSVFSKGYFPLKTCFSLCGCAVQKIFRPRKSHRHYSLFIIHYSSFIFTDPQYIASPPPFAVDNRADRA